MKYQFKKSQQLSCDIETTWKFFSSPENLSRITPKEMNFVVKSAIDGVTMFEGMEINYTVTPLLNIPLKWKTRITQVEFQKSFTDFQEKGPYKYWNHHHEFIVNKNGVLMIDTIEYELPLGSLGRLMNTLVVRKKLNKIFDYRTKIADDLFNTKNING